ncbi:MAG TPA: NAD(P)/FAD-dependent oxidoreductase [Burkholderiales bacterium]|nr:NAD(P)/FAD-dependent oxidoreductase [Burkholderiales bacterium]
MLLDENRAQHPDPSAPGDGGVMGIVSADVCVLGLGPAGASAAAEAARRGCRVLAVDRKREAGRPVQCAEFVPSMIGVDVGNLTGSVQQRIRAMTTFVEERAPDIKENFPGQMLDRRAFDAALVAAAERAGAHCRLGVGVRRITAAGGVELSSGEVVAAGVIVGADGPRSLAGRAIGQVNTELVVTRQITVALRQPHEATDIFLSADIPGGYGWLFPKGEVANLGAGVDPAHRARLRHIIRRLHKALVESGRVGREVLGLTGGLIPVGGMRTPWSLLDGTLVLLAGDAAGLTNPVTGAGIAAAVQSGKLAGQTAAAWIAGDRSAGADYEDELESVFKAALDRALRRRRELARALAAGVRPNESALRRGWIAYPEYWAA